MDDTQKAALGDALKAMFEAAKSEDWDGAAQAFMDADSITDQETGEAEKTPAPEPKDGKKPLAAILIGGGGPPKK